MTGDAGRDVPRDPDELKLALAIVDGVNAGSGGKSPRDLPGVGGHRRGLGVGEARQRGGDAGRARPGGAARRRGERGEGAGGLKVGRERKGRSVSGSRRVG